MGMPVGMFMRHVHAHMRLHGCRSRLLLANMARSFSRCIMCMRRRIKWMHVSWMLVCCMVLSIVRH